MDITDSVEESRRLQELYGRMTDDELLNLTQDTNDLTDIAREILHTEISGRGLKLQIQDGPKPEVEQPKGDFYLTDSDLANAGRIWSMDEARQYKKILDDARIPSYFGPDNLDDPNNLYVDSSKGVDVKVWAPYQQRAYQVLAQALPPEPGQEAAVEKESEIRCPKCHSNEIVFEGLEGEVPEGSTAYSKFNWSCDGCGYQWKDDGVET